MKGVWGCGLPCSGVLLMVAVLLEKSSALVCTGLGFVEALPHGVFGKGNQGR